MLTGLIVLQTIGVVIALAFFGAGLVNFFKLRRKYATQSKSVERRTTEDGQSYRYTTYDEWRQKKHISTRRGHAYPVVSMAWKAARETIKRREDDDGKQRN